MASLMTFQAFFAGVRVLEALDVACLVVQEGRAGGLGDVFHNSEKGPVCAFGRGQLHPEAPDLLVHRT
eukprot:11216433-Lingulodinium_polyedra.AAC.1